MSKNPLLNAFLSTLYVSGVASFMFYAPKYLGPEGKADTVFAPIAMLSLFVLSAAIMGYLFLSQPAQLYLNGQRGEAVGLFLRTVAIFACFTLLAFLLLFFSLI